MMDFSKDRVGKNSTATRSVNAAIMAGYTFIISALRLSDALQPLARIFPGTQFSVRFLSA